MAECSEIKLKIEEEWSDNEMTDQLKHQQSDAMLQQGAVVKIEIENSDGEESHDVKPELDIGETMLQRPGNHYMITEPKVEINEEEPPTTSSDQNNSGEKLNPGRAASTNTDKDDIGLEVELKEVHHPFMYYQLFMEPKIEINTPSQSDNEGSSSLEINGTLGDGPVNTKSGGRRSNQTFTIVTDESDNSKKPGKKLYCCADCGQSFHRFSRLKEHRRTHTGEKPYTCEFCNKTFFTSSNLSMHVKTHTGDKPFECPTCGKSFVRLYHLNRHFLTHTGEKPYPCVDCGQKFSRQSHLDEHRTTHTGIKPFPCVVCGQRFARSSHLEEHKTVHSGVKAHNCPDCGKNFSRSSYLRIHRRSVHHINI